MEFVSGAMNAYLIVKMQCFLLKFLYEIRKILWCVIIGIIMRFMVYCNEIDVMVSSVYFL